MYIYIHLYKKNGGYLVQMSLQTPKHVRVDVAWGDVKPFQIYWRVLQCRMLPNGHPNTKNNNVITHDRSWVLGRGSWVAQFQTTPY